MDVGRDGRVASLLSRPERSTAKANAVVHCHILAERDFIVLMLNCAGTSETKVDNVIIVFHSVQVARRLTDFSIPVLTGFQGRALKLAPHCYFLRL